MKQLYTLLFVLVSSLTFANPSPTLFTQLRTINNCWQQQPDIGSLPVYGTAKQLTDHQLIQLHLQLVEKTLRSRSTAGLTEAQKKARNRNLDHLHVYWQINTYPINNKTVLRNPVFIDDHNTFCAVGYLIKTSGYEPLARKIASTHNLYYLKDMEIPELDQWVAASGLTLDELAWIQPGYFAGNNSRSLGKGVNGPVYAIAGHEATNMLYVAGHFNKADDQLNCNNIVAIKYDQQSIFSNTFTLLGSGLNGTVKTLYNDDTVLYAGGEFDASGNTILHNIAKWNGIIWEPLGELNGTVKCIEKFEGHIYAGGAFTYSYNGRSYQNLAYWDGTNWKPISEHPIGTVNALKTILNTRLIVGGEFTRIDTTVVNHIFVYGNQEITPLGSGVAANVRTIDWDGKNYLVAGDFINQNPDTFFGYAFYNPAEQTWSTPYVSIYDSNTVIHAISDGYVGGKFKTTTGMGYSLNTGILRSPTSFFSFASTDGDVFSILKLGKRVFFGGSFSAIYSVANRFDYSEHPTNNLAVWDPDYVGIQAIEASPLTFNIAPNPTSGRTTIESANSIQQIRIIDVSGKLIMENHFEKGETSYNLERGLFPSSGLYLITLKTADGNIQNQKLLVAE